MNSFKELQLSPSIQSAIEALGYETMTPIQAEALPILLGESTDFLGLAATGTGKTAAFAIPLLERIDPKKKGVQALILCPTRELALQVAGQIDLLGKQLGVRALPVYGGAGYGDQIYGLKRGATIVVGTPGRVVDHMNKGTLALAGLTTLVLDEADEMISMGFKEDLETVLGQVPAGQANTWLFSATMSPAVRKVADTYLKKPKQVQVNKTEMVPVTVEQIYYSTSESHKPEVLCKIIDAADEFYGIVFCQTKALVVDLHQYLVGRGYKADALHGDLDQNARERVMRAFRARKVTLLIATDVACRGLDVKDITHVVNYSIPRELDNYVHRIGRTGRSGKEGLAISLVTPSHRGLVGRVERMTRTKMREAKIPTRREVGTKKVSRLREVFQKVENPTRAAELLDADWQSALEAMTKEEIAGRFITLLNPEVFGERAAAQEEESSRAQTADHRPRPTPTAAALAHKIRVARPTPGATPSAAAPRPRSSWAARPAWVDRKAPVPSASPAVSVKPKAEPKPAAEPKLVAKPERQAKPERHAEPKYRPIRLEDAVESPSEAPAPAEAKAHPAAPARKKSPWNTKERPMRDFGGKPIARGGWERPLSRPAKRKGAVGGRSKPMVRNDS